MRALLRSVGRLVCLALFVSAPVLYANTASSELFSFDNPQHQQSFDELTRELRCLVCQNQSIAESNATLAVDLKRLVKSKLEQGESKKEIIAYLKERYGDFVHYKPGIQQNTWLLWFGPFLLLLFSLLLIVKIIKKAARAPAYPENQA